MNKKTLKLMVAGALVTCAIGAFTMGLVWATDPVGYTATPIVGPVAFDEIDTRSHSHDWRVRITTRGLSDVYVTHIRIVPGGTPAGTRTRALPSSRSKPAPRRFTRALIWSVRRM